MGRAREIRLANERYAQKSKVPGANKQKKVEDKVEKSQTAKWLVYLLAFAVFGGVVFELLRLLFL